MKRTISAAILLAFVAIPSQGVHASLRSAPQSNDQRSIVLKLSDLRSAYLQRAGVVSYDQTNLSPEGLRRQLQRHFDVVLGVLLVSTPHSIDTALARLEAADGHKWSANECANRRRQLLAMRYLQLRRLAAYRDRGLFPLNEGQADHAVPIFVDRRGTACAVGHLMQLSGWISEVEAIHDANNLVYVPDALSSAVAEWALSSGLTWEEAALIQPAYGLVTPFFASDYEPGELSLIRNGLKYENFQIQWQFPSTVGQISQSQFHSFANACGDCALTGTVYPANNVGLNAGANLLPGYFGDVLDPVGNRWAVLGGVRDYSFDNDSYRLLNGYSQFGTIQRIQVSFDVSTTGSNAFIEQITEHSYPAYGGFGPQGSSFDSIAFQMTTTARTSPGGLILASVSVTEAPTQDPFTPRIATSNLAFKTNQLHVTSNIWLYNGATINGYVLGFQVVPEPSAALLTVVAVVAGAGAGRRRSG